jgi:hypothetical protein
MTTIEIEKKKYVLLPQQEYFNLQKKATLKTRAKKPMTAVAAREYSKKHIYKEPLDIDFTVDPRPLTKKEQLAISAFIKADKEKRALLAKRATKIKTAKRTKAIG